MRSYTWDEYYTKFYDWAESTQARYLSMHPYNYKIDDPTIRLGDQVLVPVGDKETIGTVVSVGQYLRIGAPFPVDKMKTVIRKVNDSVT